MGARLVAVGVVVAALVLASCGEGDGDDGGSEETLTVVASTTIVADWVEQVGGEHVEVSSIVPRETDIHGFVLAPSDIQRIGEADVVFMVGASIEPFAGDVDSNAGGEVVELAEGLELRSLPAGVAHQHDEDDHDHDHGDGDPHIWMYIDLAKASVERIGEVLSELDPENAEAYRENAGAYAVELDAVDQEIRGMLAELPEHRRYLVTFHDAYGYFAARYDLELLGFLVESADEQPSASAVAALVDAIREHEVAYIYTEPQFDSRALEQLARDAGAEVRTIPSDSLSEDYPNYVSFLRAIASGIAE